MEASFTLWQLICFGVLTTPLAMASFAFVVFIPTFYAVDMGLGLGLVGGVFVAGRLFDVVTDPLIGYLSDETRTRWGPRRPWIVLGAPAFSVSIWLLLAPPEGAGLIYLLIASGMYFLFYTALDVPYSSIGLEISPHVHERSLLASSKAVFQVIGALTVAVIPLVFALPTPAALGLIAQIMIVLCFVGLASFLIFVPGGYRPVTAPRITMPASLKMILASPAYRNLVLTFLIIQSANALSAGLAVLFITHVIGAPELVGAFVGLTLLSSALFLPVWVMISKRFSKIAAWRAAIITCCIILSITPFLGHGDVVGMAVLSVVIGAAFGADAIMPTSMLADIVYAEEKDGKNRLAGLYLAVKNAVSKLAFIVPMGLAFPVLDLVDFNETGSNSETQLFTLTFFYALMPIIFRFIALVVLRRAPQTQELVST
ncbi:MFS transporter [Kordiimonas aquimaris]|uniref:MFS transporter n=1 Tax=Kordiimonas aquimaris TaxID=707591 RepID=UPI0021D0027D|nr:MFS transporter [Kordiimonas aquimaris]